jgi:hypothetical protein
MSRGGILQLVALPIAVSFSTSAFGGVCHKECRPRCCDVQRAEFFGYFPTCWRTWPEGWSNCPAAVPSATRDKESTKRSVKPIEPQSSSKGSADTRQLDLE